MSEVPDYTLEDTLDFKFTTRAFATGVPTAWASGAIEIYEDNSTTQITGAETLTLEFDGVAGLHNLRVAATAANGFENGKTYHCVASAGTVGGTAITGEVVQQFSIGRSSSAVDLANGTDGLGALKTLIDTADAAIDAVKTETALIVADTNELQGDWVDGGRLDLILDARMAEASIATTGGAVDNVTLVTTTTTNTDMLTAASVNAEVDTALADIHLDHLMAVAAADVVVDGSVIAHMVSTTEDWSTFVPSTDSLQAVRDRGDTAWITATGFSTVTVAQVADGVWDEARTDHTTNGTFGDVLQPGGIQRKL